MEQVKIGIAGLGRLGKCHARNLMNTRGAVPCAVCSIIEEELQWARENLSEKLECYLSYEDMLKKADIDAVFIVTSSSMHIQQIIQGFEAGKHVFCEKPLDCSVEKCRSVLDIIRNYAREKVFQMGFVRRFDSAYVYAKKRIEEGAIGKPFLMHSRTADHDDFAAFQVNYVKAGGGIFHDMNVHDIDLARWYLGSEVNRVYAVGGSYVHKDFEKVQDADNTMGTCEFEDGSLAFISASRTAFHGHDTRAEIQGTKGIIRIGYTSSVSDVEILDSNGVRREGVHTFFDRFEDAFKREAQFYIDSILGKEKVHITVDDAFQATLVAEALSRSFKEKRVIETSDNL